MKPHQRIESENSIAENLNRKAKIYWGIDISSTYFMCLQPLYLETEAAYSQNISNKANVSKQ